VSTQRVIVDERRHDELVERLSKRVAELRTGDPADARTTLSPVIDAGEAARVAGWIGGSGGEVVCGGEHDGAVVEPAIVLAPPLDAALWRDELFGPAVAVRVVPGDDEALRLANATRFGLAMSVFTRDVDRATRFAHGLRAGIVNVNPPLGATWRADFMPWGGFGASGFGKEGARYAVRDMTEDKLVVVHP
jgi:acyl-CoA reductase-like NAD-dependent aldehyde dehydrogenase